MKYKGYGIKKFESYRHADGVWKINTPNGWLGEHLTPEGAKIAIDINPRKMKRKTRRKKNPRTLTALYAKRGSIVLKYDGRHFTRLGHAKLFRSRAAALQKGIELIRKHGRTLKGWKLYAR
jgi:hypothetical protein